MPSKRNRTQQLAKSVQLEAELAKRDTRLSAQEHRHKEALEALHVEKQAFQAEREAYKHAAQVREACVVGADGRQEQPIPAPTVFTLENNGGQQHCDCSEANAGLPSEFDSVRHSTGLNNGQQESHSGHSRGYVQDSVYIGKSRDNGSVHVQNISVAPVPSHQFSIEERKLIAVHPTIADVIC